MQLLIKKLDGVKKPITVSGNDVLVSSLRILVAEKSGYNPDQVRRLLRVSSHDEILAGATNLPGQGHA